MSNDMERLARLVGGQRRVSEALGMSESHVSRMVNERKAVPVYVTALCELLESLPPKDWPQRWR